MGIFSSVQLRKRKKRTRHQRLHKLSQIKINHLGKENHTLPAVNPLYLLFIFIVFFFPKSRSAQPALAKDVKQAEFGKIPNQFVLKLPDPRRVLY